jgi:hypothetical protein
VALVVSTLGTLLKPTCVFVTECGLLVSPLWVVLEAILVLSDEVNIFLVEVSATCDAS